MGEQDSAEVIEFDGTEDAGGTDAAESAESTEESAADSVGGDE